MEVGKLAVYEGEVDSYPIPYVGIKNHLSVMFFLTGEELSWADVVVSVSRGASSQRFNLEGASVGHHA